MTNHLGHSDGVPSQAAFMNGAIPEAKDKIESLRAHFRIPTPEFEALQQEIMAMIELPPFNGQGWAATVQGDEAAKRSLIDVHFGKLTTSWAQTFNLSEREIWSAFMNT